jgi:hypothetical protein
MKPVPEQDLPDDVLKDRLQWSADHFNYADQTAGNRATYDIRGRYNCGSCGQFEDGGCKLLNIGAVDAEAGSCEDWEEPDDQAPALHRKDPKVANYGVAANGQGFGCSRCPFQVAASKPRGPRKLGCKELVIFVEPNGCCTNNGADLIPGRK